MEVSSNNMKDFRTASFSAYLDIDTTEEHEIGVFQAEKYFNMDLDDEETRHNNDHEKTRKNHHRHASPQLSRSKPKEILHYRRKKNNIFSRFGCNGRCSDSESVRVSETAHVKRLIPSQKVKASSVSEEEQFEFPVLSSLEEQRNSIEVFGPRKMSAPVTWDAIPKTAVKGPVSYRTDSGREYETESCASSDLFEIDNICNVSGRKQELPKVKGRCRSSEKTGFHLDCKNQRAVTVVSESTNRNNDHKPKKS